MDKQAAENLARKWIQLQYTDEKSSQYMPLIEESIKLDELMRTSPSASLEVIALIIAQDSSDHILANLGAGPLEDILSKHGNFVIESIEAWATRDDIFRQTLSLTWKQGMSEEIWLRVQAATTR